MASGSCPVISLLFGLGAVRDSSLLHPPTISLHGLGGGMMAHLEL